MVCPVQPSGLLREQEVYSKMDEWNEIRQRVIRDGVSRRAIARETGYHHSTVKKIVENPAPPGYRQSVPRPSPKLGPHVDWIKSVLAEDAHAPKKQRHTARRIFLRLKEERDYQGGETVVRELVSDILRTSREVFMPLSQPPGEAQVDFFEALVKYRPDGLLAKVHVFAMHLPFSDGFFLKAYERECTEVFWDGHVSAFEVFGGVPRRISYDNLRIAVSKIIGRHTRRLTPAFLQLRSHYLFDSHFCNVRRGNEKGCVEGLAKYARTHFMVPVPIISDLGELNEMLRLAAWNDGLRSMRGSGGRTKHQMLADENLLPLPAVPFAACRQQAGRASSLALVRFDDNDYSVPVRYAHHELVVKGFVDQVSIFTPQGVEVARHRRKWGREDVSYDPLHYLPLLEDKPGSLDYGAPFVGLALPPCFDDLRRRMESAFDHRGVKEYVAVLRLIEKRSIERVAAAVTKALRVCDRPTVETVRAFLFDEETPEAATFRLGHRSQLAGVRVAPPDVAAYLGLLPRKDQE